MINPTYRKPLFNLARKKAREEGLYRSVIVINPLDSANYALYELIVSIEGRAGMTNAEIFQHMFGEETSLLETYFLSSFWFWRVVREACLKNSDNAIAQSIAEIRNQDKESFREKWDVPVEDMHKVQVAEFIAHGFLLWDSRNGIVRNPVFF